MRTRSFGWLFVSMFLGCVILSGGAWAVDEKINPIGFGTVPTEDKQFREAMGIWYSHRYDDAKGLLKDFVKKHPDSRWAAEAQLHVGCKSVFDRDFGEARSIFSELINKHLNDIIGVKAKMRLGNVAEFSGNLDEAVTLYRDASKKAMTWDQFKYTNHRVKFLSQRSSMRKALINCGPVALAACLESLCKVEQAAKARKLVPDDQGDSLAGLAWESEKLGVVAKPVEMSMAELQSAELPVLAHIEPNHYVAVLGIDRENARLRDSIDGEHMVSLQQLASVWSGKGLTFAVLSSLKPLDVITSIETLGGCCGVWGADPITGPGDCPPCGPSQPGGGLGGPGGCGGSGSGRSLDYLGGGGCSGGGGTNRFLDFASPGRPSYKVKLGIDNILVQDTPIWYNPGRGPAIGFTLTYSNENSNSGIFGNSVRCTFDSKVFFPPDDSLQVHTSDGAIEEYSWNGVTSKYDCKTGIYGELVDVEMRRRTDSSVKGKIIVIQNRDGSRMYYRSANESLTDLQGRLDVLELPAGPKITTLGQDITTSSPADSYDLVLADTSELAPKGAILVRNAAGDEEIITYTSKDDGQDKILGITRGMQGTDPISALSGADVVRLLRATCNYDATDGHLVSITDANGRDTEIDSNGTGLNERVSSITLPDGDERTALFTHDAFGNLTSITDMAGATSYLDYGGLIHSAAHSELTTAFDAQSTTIVVGVPSGVTYPDSGWVKVGGVFGELVQYSSVQVDTQNQTVTFSGLTKAHPTGAYQYSVGTMVYSAAPYLSAIQTPAAKTLFAYAAYNGRDGFIELAPGRSYDWVALWATYELSPSEDWPDIYDTENNKPTWAYSSKVFLAWEESIQDYSLRHHPTTCTEGVWSGGLETKYAIGMTSTVNITRSTTDAEGSTESYAYDEANNRTGTTGSGDGSIYTFQDHRMTQRTDANGHIWKSNYDANTKNLTSTECYDSDGTTLLRKLQALTYDSNNLVTRVETTDPDDATDTLPQMDAAYNSDRKPIYTDTYIMHSALSAAITSGSTAIPLSDVTGFPTTGLIRINDELIAYGAKDAVNNQLTTLQRGALNTTAASADSGTRVSAFTRAESYYDEDTETRGFLTSQKQVFVDTQAALQRVTTEYTYDEFGRRETVTDPNGVVATYTYDDLDRVIQVSSAAPNLPTTTKKSEYSCCQTLWEEDENGHRVYHIYDLKKLPIWQVTCGASTTLVAPIDADDTTIPLTSAAAFSDTGGYAVIGNEVISYTGKSFDDLVGAQRGVGGTLASAHDEEESVGKQDARVGFTYDGYDRKASLIDANGHSTTYDYYKNNRLKKTTYPDGTWEQYEYDGAGRTTRKITSNGVVTNYTYDEAGRLTKESSE